MSSLDTTLTERLNTLLEPLESSLEGLAQHRLPVSAPEPLTVARALHVLRTDSEALVAATLADIQRTANTLLDKKFAKASLQRAWLGEAWPWAPDHPLRHLLHQLVQLHSHHGLQPLPARVSTAEQPHYWPGEAAAADVARRFRERLNRLDIDKAAGNTLMEQADSGQGYLSGVMFTGKSGERWTFSGTALALLHLAARDIDRGRRRKAMAIDAGRDHHSLLSGWKDLPQDRQRHTGAVHEFAQVQPLGHERLRVMLFDRREQQSIQLQLPMPHEGLHANTITALRNIRGAKGLRHWCAIQRLLSVEGARQGWVRWSLDQHMEAMGYEERMRRDPAKRSEIAEEVEALTELELVAYAENNQERHRAPLLLVGNRFEHLKGAAWALEGMELRINDLLYGGVRDSQTGKLGTNWLPVPIELAQQDHVRHPYAHALGLLVSIRMRWDLWGGRDHLLVKSRTLLTVAGIPYDHKRPGRAWSRLTRELELLCSIGLLARVEPPEPLGTEEMFKLYPSQWIVDRAQHQIPPDEGPASPPPMTGTELAEWRDKHDVSVTVLARKLGVSRTTVYNAERGGEKKLSKRFFRRMQELVLAQP